VKQKNQNAYKFSGTHPPMCDLKLMKVAKTREREGLNCVGLFFRFRSLSNDKDEYLNKEISEERRHKVFILGLHLVPLQFQGFFPL